MPSIAFPFELHYILTIARSSFALIHLHEDSVYSSGEIAVLAEIERKDADVVVITIALDSIMYTEPVNDPLFSAHKTLKSPEARGRTMYVSDNPVGVIGCALRVCWPLSPVETND